jgi:hypothetical protein
MSMDYDVIVLAPVARLGVGAESSRQIEREALHRLRAVASAPALRAA